MYFFGDTPAGDDLVGITFWIGTMAMMAASAFFFLSLNSVEIAKKTMDCLQKRGKKYASRN